MNDQDLLSSFHREANGSWTCVKPVLIDGTVRNMALVPGVNVSRVNLFMGFDLARQLDEAAERQAPEEPRRSTVPLL